MPASKSYKFSYFTGMVQVLIGLFFLFVAFLAHYTVSDFRENAVKVNGTVIRLQKVFNKQLNKDELYPVITYEVNGNEKMYFFKPRFEKNKLKVNDSVELFVDPRFDDRVKVGSFDDMWSSITMIFFMGSFFFMMGLFTTNYFGKKFKTRQLILAEGRVVFAKVVEIKEEKIIPMSKNKAFRIIAKYEDPFKAKQYTFVSDYLYGEWTSEVRPELVKVFIHPTDENSYIMDLSSLSRSENKNAA